MNIRTFTGLPFCELTNPDAYNYNISITINNEITAYQYVFLDIPNNIL